MNTQYRQKPGVGPSDDGMATHIIVNLKKIIGIIVDVLGIEGDQ